MKLVKQVKLYFQEGTSDKVYEIDLCESGDGYVVNFRYGRRGAALKEGTKTIFPIEQAEAEKIFSALEQEKRKKGYVAAGESPNNTAAEPRANSGGDKRRKAILKILKAAAAGEEPESWRLSRVIWRAGDLNMQEAIPHIIKLVDPADTFNIYSTIWAIGRSGTDKALPFLQSLQSNQSLPAYTRQMLVEALLKFSEGKEKESLVQTILQTLPAPLQKSASEKNFKLVDKQVREYLFELKTTANEYLIGLYQLARQEPAWYSLFLKLLEDIPLTTHYFKHIRHIFKAAEMLEDYGAYGIIAKNIEKKPAAYKSSASMAPEQKKNRGFSNKTKAYLTHRVLRFLRHYGKAGEPSYTELATDILLAFDDQKDLTPAYHTTDVSYQFDATTRQHTRNERVTHFDTYAHFHAFNTILYANSPRYLQKETAWMCVPPFTPGSSAPQAREEGYPQLWDKAPDEIIRLLSFSNALRVHEFALKVFNANAAFEGKIEIQNIIDFIQTPFVLTQQLALSLARKKYDRLTPDKRLLITLLDCSLSEAREQAGQWVTEQKTALLADSEFILSLLKMKKLEAHTWLRGFLSTVTIPKEQSEIITAKLIAHLITIELDNEEDERQVTQLADTLTILFAATLRQLSLEIIKDLFRHKSAVIHALAGKILMQHEVKAENLPEDFLQVLLQSSHANSRGIGISLLGQFPEDRLMAKKEILVSFCLSPLADVRNAVKPLIVKLVNAYPVFGHELVELFVPAFLMKESYGGLHDDLLSLLATELGECLSIISKERSLLLLHSRFKAAQQIGLLLLKKNIQEEELTVPELVKMGSNPQQEVRLYTWSAFKKQTEKIKANKEAALKLADSNWDDTRIFAFDYFRTTFTAADWTTELLVSLCDSVREGVQDFGRAMITQFFQAEHGKDYLLKLSQHPSTKVQLFTTAYLEQYAGGQVAIIQSLSPYFVTLLSQVNKGRVAKIRAMDFLRKESLKDEETARIATDIFTRVSVSVAISEKAACIAALRDIQAKYPTVQSPVRVKQYSDYTKA